jgi:hypothetical protein
MPQALPARSAFVAAVLGWVVPGLGQVYVGRPLKGLVLGLTIGGLFLGGLALTGFTCVNPDTYSLEFAAHALIGGPTAAAYWLSRDVVLTHPLPWFEVGRLYAAVAGLLNVVAICDALGDVIEHKGRVAVREREREAFLETLRARAARHALDPAESQALLPDPEAESEAATADAETTDAPPAPTARPEEPDA